MFRRRYTVEPDVVTPQERDALRRSATSPALLGPSQLVGTFGQTRGFGLVFSRDDVDAALQMVPGFAPLRDMILRPSPLLSRWPRWLTGNAASDTANAFYVNALVLEGGAGVGPHLDGTLGPALGDEGRTPLFVSVLYLEVPPPPSGTLTLLRGAVAVASIAPVERTRVTFDGSLGHGVSQHPPANDDTASPRRRISIVCEHYRASAAECALLGPPRLHSRSQGPVFPAPARQRPFDAFVRKSPPA